MSEYIKFSKIDNSVQDWVIVRNFIKLNHDLEVSGKGSGLMLDVDHDENSNEWSIEVADGARELVVAALGQMNAIALQE